MNTTRPDESLTRTIHGLDLNTVVALAERGAGKHPELAARIERATNVVTFRNMRRTSNAWIVESNSTRGRFHRVWIDGRCDCADFTRGHAPSGWCLHRLAVALVERADEDRQRDAQQAVQAVWLEAASMRGY